MKFTRGEKIFFLIFMVLQILFYYFCYLDIPMSG